ncbi:hypothetical protein AnigIFM56816_010507 [Aspergillus niger]|nr:hypothetical protein AnigIFM56816_010507 [Aspergillus niger]
MPPPSRRLLIFQEARNPQSPSEIVYLPVNKLGLPICGDGPELPSMLELPLRILRAFTDIFNQPKYKGWALVGAGPYHDTSVEGKYYAVVLEQVQEVTVLLEERIDGGFTAISPSSNSATLGDGDSAKSDDETPTTRRPPTYSLSDGEDNDCTDSDIVNPSQSTTVPSASSHDGILTPSQSTATTRAFSPADVDRSDDPKRDGVKISDSDGLSPANKTVPSTEKSYKTPEIATDYGSDTDGDPIDSGRRRRQPIMTEVPPREPPSQPATDFFSGMASTDYTWGGIDASGCNIEFVPDQESRSNPIRVGPGPEIPSGSDPQSKTNHFTPSTTRKPLPYPPANNGLPTSRATPYYTKWGWYQPPAYGPTNPFGPQ